ncbi:MAG: xanthine dehydrogenase small subunit [Pseudomonadales bacterium]
MRDTIRFLFRGEIKELVNPSPTQTILEWLRLDMAQTGTKEGCAEGDCGTCTVAVGELYGNTIRYQAINSCIRFMPTLDGKHLLTVEDLKSPDGKLHPVQQSLVQQHGSQCGFCTPGIVMSLFAHYCAEGSTDRATIDTTLAGNLCRCTGYGSIIAAAQAAQTISEKYCVNQKPDQTIARLNSIKPLDSVALKHNGRQYFAPVAAQRLAEMLQEHPTAVLLSGGTDVGLWVTKQHRSLATVIYTGNVAELNAIKVGADHIEIGAATTYTDSIELLTTHFPDFGEILRRLGATQVRNAGTIGGNVGNGSPIGDTLPVLIALGASVRLRRVTGVREIALQDYFIDYGVQDREQGEFIESISVPLLKHKALFGAYKVSKRFDEDISAVLAAFSLEIENGKVCKASIAYGGMAAIPKRASACEQALVGACWNETNMERAVAALVEDFTPLTDWRASANYRSKVAANLLRRFWLEHSGIGQATRILGHEVRIAELVTE